MKGIKYISWVAGIKRRIKGGLQLIMIRSVLDIAYTPVIWFMKSSADMSASALMILNTSS